VHSSRAESKQTQTGEQHRPYAGFRNCVDVEIVNEIAVTPAGGRENIVEADKAIDRVDRYDADKSGDCAAHRDDHRAVQFDRPHAAVDGQRRRSGKVDIGGDRSDRRQIIGLRGVQRYCGMRAAKAGVSLEAYLRHILQKASLANEFTSTDIAQIAEKYFDPEHGVALDLPERGTKRQAVDFDA